MDLTSIAIATALNSRGLGRVNNKRRFRQPPGYATQKVTDLRFNHALRRDAFANTPTSRDIFKTL